MASSLSSESNCIRCVKFIGTFTCRGCGNNFCMSLANEHRQMLLREMDEDIIPLHDQLCEDLSQQSRKSLDHPLFNDIDRWEKNSIEIIHQTGENLRKDIFLLIEKPKIEMKEKLEKITEELKRARDNDHFFENDLKQWIIDLNHLSNQLNTSPQIDLQYSTDHPPLISRIVFHSLKERFEQSIGNINIIQNGSKIVHNQTNIYASVRALKDYYQGEHHLHFIIDNLTNNWIFIGILSKDSIIPEWPTVGKSAYGWSGLNNVWRDGIRSSQLDGYISDFQINDQIHLFINCNEKRISFRNERTNLTYRLNIDINDCPLPWKLTLGLFHSPGESIRLIQ